MVLSPSKGSLEKDWQRLVALRSRLPNLSGGVYVDACRTNSSGEQDNGSNSLSPMTSTELHIVAGAAGVGKSTFGKDLASKLAGVLLDSDTVTEPVVRAGLAAAGLDPADRDSPEYKRLFRDAVYECLFHTAADNLQHIHVVIVGPFTRELGDPSWPIQLAERFGVTPTVWYLSCDDELRRQRIEQRANPRDQAKLIDWQQHVSEAPVAKPAFAVQFVDTSD